MQLNNIIQVLSAFLDELGVPVTHQSITEELSTHPNAESLLAISEVLNTWRVPNAAYELTLEQLLAAEFSGPLITHLSNRGGEFVIVNVIKDDYILISNERLDRHRLEMHEFKVVFSGAVLFAEKDEKSGERDYRKKFRKELLGKIRIPFVISCLALLLVIFLMNNSAFLATFNWLMLILILAKMMGLVSSIMLLIHSFDANNPLIKKLCGIDNKKKCNAILASKAAKISDELNWSEVVFFILQGRCQFYYLGVLTLGRSHSLHY